MSHLRAGLLGCGEGAFELAERCAWHGHLDLVALCDTDPQAVRALSELTGLGRTFLRPQDLLESGIDLLIAHAPPPKRDEAVTMALHEGVPCLLRAPLAEDPQVAEVLALAAAATGARLGVWVTGFEDPALLELRGLWEQEWFGAPRECSVQTDAFADVPGWDRAGPLALLSWLTGRPVESVDPDAGRAVLRGGIQVRIARGGSPAVQITGSAGQARWGIAGLTLSRGAPRFRRDEASLRACDPIGRFARWLDDEDDFPLTGDQAVEHVRLLERLRSGGP